MARIIGLSGAQGGGKSSLLNGLKAKGWVVDDFKLSRSVQVQLGWDTLDNATSSVKNMVQFQNTLFQVKKEHELANAARTDVDVILVERTFADIAAYTYLWTKKLSLCSGWGSIKPNDFSYMFADMCASAQRVYDINLYLPYMDCVLWEDDPRRAKREDVEYIDTTLWNFLTLRSPADTKVFQISTRSISDRVQQVHDFLEYNAS